MAILSFLFGLQARVDRGAYLRWGFGLAAVKFAIDTAVVYAFTGVTWSPLGYVIPSITLRQYATGPTPGGMYVALAILALPFLWIGVAMSVRRAADAGLTAWIGLLLVAPILNYFVIAALSVVPSTNSATWSGSDRDPAAPVEPGVRAALLGVLASVGLGLAMIGISVFGLRLYGATLFFGTPFAMGVVSSLLYNRPVVRSLGSTLGVASAGVLLTGTAVLLFAIEGVLCLAMAAPIALIIAAFGAVLARAVVRESRGPRSPVPAFMIVLPGLAFGEAHVNAPTPRDVTTSIDIDAPPERVWPNVIGFTDLDEVPTWFFDLGIAYPLRAQIDGQGVGAVRRCQFSTGDFVEPITAWQPPERLAFDVASQPPSMTEWSPYGAIHAPHLEGYMVSKGGEFDLTRLPDGHTRLVGTTHYTLAIYPELYWTPYAEALLHAIHGRVLTHIKRLSER